jgi:hypothetical protein
MCFYQLYSAAVYWLLAAGKPANILTKSSEKNAFYLTNA